MATHIGRGRAGSDPEDVTAIGRTVYFTAVDRAHGRELWKLTVPLAPQMFLLGQSAAVKTGSSVTFTATMEPAPGARQPSGTVTFYDDGTKIGSVVLKSQASGGPTASLTTTAPSGNHQIVAVYSGNSHYLPATSNASPLTGD
jgi:hypothetical protein